MADLHAVVATNRPTVEAFFAGLNNQDGRSVVVSLVSLDARAIAEASDAVDAATVAVIDASVDLVAALELCQELRQRRPTLPITAMFCCQHSVTAANVRAFVAAGVKSFMNSQLAGEETLRVLRALTRGEAVFHLQLTEESSALLADVFGGRNGHDELSTRDIRLLTLVARGLTDRQIGRHMHLSPHTVKHHIEQLRGRVRARNRVELAAWAGQQGLCASDDTAQIA